MCRLSPILLTTGLICVCCSHAFGLRHIQQEISGNGSYFVDVNVSTCPSWFLDYEKFHTSSRGRSESRYLIQQVSGVSGGLGDRLRGMIFALRLATALQRVLLVTWEHPADITAFFTPSGSINWSTDNVSNFEQGPTLDLIDHPRVHEQVQPLITASDSFLTIRTNAFMDTNCTGCPPMDAWSDQAACILRRLVRPNSEVLNMAYRQLQQLYGSSIKRHGFAATHLRLGHLHGEPDPDQDRTGGGPLKTFIAGVRCANQLAAKHAINIAEIPILVVTDHPYLRAFLQQGHLANVVAPLGVPAVHLDHAHDAHVDAHRNTFVELVMLAMSQCLVTSRSGFSHIAWLLGGAKPCCIHVHACI